MKTVEQAAAEIEKVVNGKLTTAFRKGVEFAQRWIPVEEELPERMKLVEVRNYKCIPAYSHSFINNSGKWWNPYNNYELNPKPEHWRPIELK